MLVPVIANVLGFNAMTAAWAWTAVEVASYAIVAAGTAYAGSLLVKAPDFSSLESAAAGKVRMSRESTPTRRVCYGINKVSGPLAYAGTTGDKNVDLHMIILLAGHECNFVAGSDNGHRGVYVNDTLAQGASGGVLAPFTGKFEALFKWGTDDQTAFDLPAGLTDWNTNESSRQLKGIAAMHVHLVADPDVYQGIPNISVVLEGKKIYDPRSDTTVFSRNPSLIIRDYLLTELGASADEINEASFISAANTCDEVITGNIVRYTCDYSFLTSEKPSSILENLLKSCYGKLLYYNGQFAIRVGEYQEPSVYLNDSDLRSGVTVTTKASIAQSYNQVTGIYINGDTYSSSFQSAEFVPVTASIYLQEDNNTPSVMNLEFPSTIVHSTARRLAKLALYDSRQDLVINYPTKVSGLQLVAGDNVYVSNTSLGWTNKVFEVMDMNINPDLSCDLVLKETSAGIYSWAESEQEIDRDLTPNTNLPSPFTVDPITNFSAINVPTMDYDGTIFPGVQLTWDNSGTGSIAAIEIDYINDTDLWPNYASLAKLAAGSIEYTTIDVEAGSTYTFRARQYNRLGVRSPYVSQSLLVIGDNTIPQTPTGSAVATTGSVTYTWTYPNPQEADYRHTKVVINSVVQGFVAGTTYTKLVAAGGPVTCSLQDFDTSGNASATSSLIYSIVTPLSVISSGSSGPSGSAGDIMTDIYKRSQIVPATPTGNLPVIGWTTTIPADDGNALWVSTGKISGADGTTLIGVWSTPQRLSGQASYYQASAPQNGVNATLAYGDLWFDTDDKYTVYRWNGSAWQTVRDSDIAPMSASIQTINGQYTVAIGNGDRVTGFKLMTSAVSSSFDVQSDRFRIYNVTNGTVTQSFQADANGVYIDEATIRSLNAGKITAGTITAAVTMSAAYINGGKIDGGGLTVYSSIGIRSKDNSSVLTITGGDDNGSSKGAQIDLTGNNSSGEGALVLQAGQGNQSSIRFYTNQSPTTDVGVLRGQFDTNGLLHILRNQSNGNTYTANAGNVKIEGNLALGSKTALNTNTGQGQIDTSGDINADGDMTAASFTTPSSERLKTNIKPLTGALDIVNALKPVSFQWKDGKKSYDTGFIAERTNEVVPHIVLKNTEGECQGIDYAKVVPFLVAVVQDQNKLIENLRQRIIKLEHR